MAIAVGNDPIQIGKDIAQKKFFLKIPMTLRAKKKSEPETAEPLVRINCTFVLIYAIKTWEGLSEDQFGAFAQTSGMFNVWPFWRQVVHTSTLHLGLPTIVLPTYRVSEGSTDTAASSVSGEKRE